MIVDDHEAAHFQAGTGLDSIDTPALLVDLDRLDRNLREMAELCTAHGKLLRPHAKSHKTVEIAHRQRELGAVGVTVAKLGEAEVYADAGIEDIFVCYPIVGNAKLERLLALSQVANLSTIVDAADPAREMAAFFDRHGAGIDVLIKLDLGMHRVGAIPADVRRLADEVARLSGLRLRGVCVHEGETYGELDPRRRRVLARDRVGRMVEVADRLRDQGLTMERVSSGATPAVFDVLDIEGLTEVRPGNYVFYDRIQVALGVVEEPRCALTVLATVVSHAEPDRAILDAGAKALSLDRGAHGLGVVADYGQVVGRPGISLEGLSEEHGWLKIGGDPGVGVGDRLRILPNHACPVVNNFDSIVLLRDGVPEERWRVAGRGRMT